MTPAKCGTPAAAIRHQKRGESPCESCKKAKAAYQQDLRVRNPALRERERMATNAGNLALRDLARLHPEEYRQLIDVHRAAMGLPPSRKTETAKLAISPAVLAPQGESLPEMS